MMPSVLVNYFYRGSYLWFANISQLAMHLDDAYLFIASMEDIKYSQAAEKTVL